MPAQVDWDWVWVLGARNALAIQMFAAQSLILHFGQCETLNLIDLGRQGK